MEVMHKLSERTDKLAEGAAPYVVVALVVGFFLGLLVG